jgi:hypothetical protein
MISHIECFKELKAIRIPIRMPYKDNGCPAKISKSAEPDTHYKRSTPKILPYH